MDFAKIFGFLNPKARRAKSANAERRANAELRSNAEKALRMKQEADAGVGIPPHRTAHEGMRDASDSGRDRSPAPEGNFTPGLKRAGVARSGDAS